MHTDGEFSNSLADILWGGLFLESDYELVREFMHETISEFGVMDREIRRQIAGFARAILHPILLNLSKWKGRNYISYKIWKIP